MTAQPADLYEILKRIRYDTTAIQAKVTDALNLLNELHVPDQPRVECRHCGLELRGERTLAEHDYQMHDGPMPAHYQAIDALVTADDFELQPRATDELVNVEVLDNGAVGRARVFPAQEAKP